MSKRTGNRRRAGVMAKLWLPVVVLIVIAAVGYGVAAVRGRNDAISTPTTTPAIPAKVIQINPKNVTYQVFGTLGRGGTVTYANLDSQPIEVTLNSLPWAQSETTMAASASLSVVAQVDGDSVGCRILVDEQIRDEHSVSHPNAAVACTVTAA